jgi:hypothetical protein
MILGEQEYFKKATDIAPGPGIEDKVKCIWRLHKVKQLLSISDILFIIDNKMERSSRRLLSVFEVG